MGKEMVRETSVIFNGLTRLITLECVINVCRCESIALCKENKFCTTLISAYLSLLRYMHTFQLHFNVKPCPVS
jgi:hypothetical protein